MVKCPERIWKSANRFIFLHRTDAVEIMKGQWPQRNFNAFFSSVSLPWEVLPTVPTTVIVPTVSPVVIMSAETVVSVRTTTNVDGARNAVIANAVVRLLAVPARTTTNVDRARNAVVANAVVVRLLVPVRPTTSVTVESIAVEEFVRRNVLGQAQEAWMPAAVNDEQPNEM